MTVDPLKEMPYRPCVGALLLNRAGEVFVARRIDTPDGWQMPQGGIDDDESPLDAVLRELAEETGVTTVEVLGESSGWLQYDLPDELIGKVLGGIYRGQRQKWFALGFTGDESEIDLQAHDEVEFDDWKWVQMADLPDMTVSFKRDLYVEIVQEFDHFGKACIKT
ncbi:MAG: RNA pyrophosphohydrolase [Rhodospirillaceae bacterium]|nr:RNA pyrophosphohydrolase [Rhodospirillaceae bacterium]